VSVTQTREPLTLATLISERCRDLGLSQAEFVSRVGCRDIQRGIRRLHELFDGNPTRTKTLIEAISSQQLLDDRKRRRFEVREMTFPVLMRGPTTNEQRKGAGSIAPYLRLISG
jgi:hypothetical protein